MSKKSNEQGLTIVSYGLLRLSAEDWQDPEAFFECLGGHALDSLLGEMKKLKVGPARYLCGRTLLLFECMLRVLAEPPIHSTVTFSGKRFLELQLLFYGALASQKFCALSDNTRQNLAYSFHNLMLGLKDKYNLKLPEFTPSYSKVLPPELANKFDNTPLDNEQLALLTPYLLLDKRGEKYNVLLGPLASVLDKAFMERFHDGLKKIASGKAKDSALRDFGTTFSRFIQDQANKGMIYTKEMLLCQDQVQDTLVDFMEYHFTKIIRKKGGAQEGTLPSLQKLWSRYINYWESLAKEGILAMPRNSFPVGNPKLLRDMGVLHRKTRETENGASEVITHKLLTPIPLRLSDEEATKLIFIKIKNDFDTIQSWLKAHLDDFWTDYESGKKVNKIEISRYPDSSLEDLLNPKKNPEALSLAVQYFKNSHGGYVDTNNIKTAAYPNLAARARVSKSKLARLLGIPSQSEALALISYLTSLDGRFTESALATAKLFDQHGNRINAVNSDAGITLSVLKERNALDGWQNVTLKKDATIWISRWLELTAPLRRYMEENHIEGWQNLFIYTGQPLGQPKAFTQSSNINSFFRQFARRERSSIGDLAEIVTISRIRATRGVIVFLDKFDIHEMARELGNSSDTSMRHYLPDSLWDYFAIRWIRIFQNLLIVEATKDGPYMQRALRFKSVEEMDEFLKNHALKPLLPPEENNADMALNNGATDLIVSGVKVPNLQEIMVAASRGIFSTLLSVKEAVTIALESGLDVNEKAMYWYEFTKRLKTHIENDSYKDRGIKKLMNEASNDICPEPYREVVCA